MLLLLGLLLVIEVEWFAPFFSGGGYCSEAIAFALSLHEHYSQHVSLKIHQHGDSFNRDFLANLPQQTQRTLGALHATRFQQAPLQSIVVCHSEPGAWYPPKYHTSQCPVQDGSRLHYNIGRTMFETDRVPAGWTERMNGMHEIWVPTHFQKDVFIAGGVSPEKLQVIPEPVDIEFYDPAKAAPLAEVRSLFEGGDRLFIFLSIFKWEERKGWRFLLEAYWKEFQDTRDQVGLVILTNQYHSQVDFEREIQKFGESVGLTSVDSSLPPVRFLKPGVPTEDMPRIYKAADAFVLPSRGEGWGRPHVEAMAMALPVISTFWSGPTEYMTSENSYPLNIDGMDVIESGAFKGHQWARPSVSHLQQLMRHVFAHPEEARQKGKQARADMVTKYSPEVMGNLVVQHLERIEALRNLKDEL
eukprot:TRINITY_DN11818_c0_g1_i5.p1 TRINITY_DN11818_c0_g1~~TRINITY_DN11818_c0_g1_i5.p1  ORF type:complete len:415 (-),score=110.89 TRINITY_DN11818_c0_g1_i5:61-1305(-)